MGIFNHMHRTSSSKNEDDEAINQMGSFLQQDMRHLHSKHSN